MVGFDSYLSKPLNISTDDSFVGSEFVRIIARLCRWLCLRLATCRNQHTSRKMVVTWTCCTSKSAHFSWHDSFVKLLAKISVCLSRWLCIRLATCRNQQASIAKPVALTSCALESAHFCRHDRFWQQLVETIERLVRWLCIRCMRVKISNSKTLEWLKFQIFKITTVQMWNCRNHRTSHPVTVFDSLLVKINTALERRFWFLLAISWNQHTSFNMISFGSRYSKSAHFSLDDSVLDWLRVANSTRLETRLWLWLVGCQNQHTSIEMLLFELRTFKN